MKQYKIINAYQILEKLSENENLTDFDQWEIYKLRKFLRPHFDFQSEREDSIRQKFKDDIDEQGNIHGEKAAAFLKDMQELSNMDIEIEERTKPQIKLVKGITCKIIEPLEDFIEFTEPAE